MDAIFIIAIAAGALAAVAGAFMKRKTRLASGSITVTISKAGDGTDIFYVAAPTADHVRELIESETSQPKKTMAALNH